MPHVISFQEVIEQLASDAFASINASATIYRTGLDFYHFQMAIHEHGEQAVVQETARVLQQRYRYTYAEACVDAGNRVRAALELVSGQDTFKTVRNNLNNQ